MIDLTDLSWVKEQRTIEPNRLDVVIDAVDLIEAAATLIEFAYLSAITGLDVGDIEVLYHFCSGTDLVTLRVRLPRDEAAVPSLSHLIPSARLYEMELREMFGVRVIGLPDYGYLFLPDDWPEGVHPLRKDAALP